MPEPLRAPIEGSLTERMKNISYENLNRPFAECYLQAFINAKGNQSTAAKLLKISLKSWNNWKGNKWSPPLTTEELQAAWEARR
jgi:hypothetical protein